jgi:hypothetical protein
VCVRLLAACMHRRVLVVLLLLLLAVLFAHSCSSVVVDVFVCGGVVASFCLVGSVLVC